MIDGRGPVAHDSPGVAGETHGARGMCVGRDCLVATQQPSGPSSQIGKPSAPRREEGFKELFAPGMLLPRLMKTVCRYTEANQFHHKPDGESDRRSVH